MLLTLRNWTNRWVGKLKILLFLLNFYIELKTYVSGQYSIEGLLVTTTIVQKIKNSGIYSRYENCQLTLILKGMSQYDVRTSKLLLKLRPNFFLLSWNYKITIPRTLLLRSECGAASSLWLMRSICGIQICLFFPQNTQKKLIMLNNRFTVHYIFRYVLERKA